MKISEIPLKSRYIPVGQDYSKWIQKDSPFYYPYILINLLQFPEDRKTARLGDDVFLLTDSGGFQVITGRTDLNWKTSLDLQLKIGATRLFAFDKPPFIKKHEGSNAMFEKMDTESTKQIIRSNVDVALEQSAYLKTIHPERVKDFFYILQGYSKELIDYNLQVLDEKIGLSNYTKFFGGICYSVKGDDMIFITTAMIHAYQNFIKKGIPVHVLGFGSPQRMLIMVRNKITTFDSTTAIVGQMYWTFFNPLDMMGKNRQITVLNSKYFPFEFPCCDCPVCTNIDIKGLIGQENKLSEAGKWLSCHNLYQMIKLNVYLDSIDLKEYTNIVFKTFDLDGILKACLEYCDLAEIVGLDAAYLKYKHFIGKETTVQRGLQGV